MGSPVQAGWNARTEHDFQSRHAPTALSVPSAGDDHISPNNTRICCEMVDSNTCLCAAFAVLATALIRRRVTRQKTARPPSPLSLPLIGNLLTMPSGPEYLAFMKLGKDLNSDVVYLEILGNRILVLNSAQAASDLLDKRSALYSDRVCPPTIKEPAFFDWSRNPAILGYNDTWRHHRRMMNNWLNSRAVTQFHRLQEKQTRSLLRRLLDVSGQSRPFETVKAEIFFTMASSMFQLAYGYHLQGNRDPVFRNLQEAVHLGMMAVMFTNFYVNLFPALARVPDWFPGTGWKRTIREWRERKERAINAPFEWTRAQVDKGVAELSILGELLQDHDLTSALDPEEKDTRLKELGVALFAGGTDTTSTALVSFIAAMILHPQIQAKAQDEIDTVLGPATLPTIADQERLPYVNRVILELMRWHPVAPTAIPHMCLQDDNYRGYDIPRNTVVIGNLWAISRDEQFYNEPEVFNPDRFLDPNVPSLPSFGWGRRKCPGMHFGEASLFLAVTSLLATYTFSKKKDESGKEIEPKIESTSNAIVFELKPFEFEFQPRSEKHHRLIQESM